MVTADCLRADHCGFCNPSSSLTPTVDHLAEEGLTFTQAIAPGPRTPSSVPVFFTGEFMANDENDWMDDWQQRQARIRRHMERFTHLSESLQHNGYETATFTANPWTTRESSFDIGFDHFNEVSADSPDLDSAYLSDSTLFTLTDSGIKSLPGDPGGWSSKKEWFSQWPGYVELIEDRIESLSEPFFLWIFILDSHQPYITPRQYREESSAWEMYYSILRYWHGKVNDEELSDRAAELTSQAYRDAVRSVDAFVETLETAVEPYDPITMLFADHGEALGEHGNFGHKRTLYEENLRVPLVVHNADTVDTVDEQLPLRSLPEMAVDLTTDDFDPQAYTQQAVISQTEANRTKSVRTPQWKLISEGEKCRLFNLQNDPEETTNVAEMNPEITDRLVDILTSHTATQKEKADVGDAATDLLAATTEL